MGELLAALHSFKTSVTVRPDSPGPDLGEPLDAHRLLLPHTAQLEFMPFFWFLLMVPF